MLKKILLKIDKVLNISGKPVYEDVNICTCGKENGHIKVNRRMLNVRLQFLGIAFLGAISLVILGNEVDAKTSLYMYLLFGGVVAFLAVTTFRALKGHSFLCSARWAMYKFV